MTNLSADGEAHAPRRRLLGDNYLDEQEEAQELGVTVRTLRHWRARGEGPPYIKIGRSVYYPVTASLVWLSAGGSAEAA